MSRIVLAPHLIDPLIDLALAEDIHTGDVTTRAIVPAGTPAVAHLRAKEPLVVCGLEVTRRVFQKVDPSLRFTVGTADGRVLHGGDTAATIVGPAGSLLTAERTALNFVQRMSGVATLSRAYADAVSGSRTRVLDTRKTLPGWRLLDKYAVATGGCVNHRWGLYDGILIKNNHIDVAGGVSQAVARARAAAGHLLKIEVEVRDDAELKAAIQAGADAVLLDNMDDAGLQRAVAEVNGRIVTEASGGMTLERVRRIASIGLDFISVGALTHSVSAVDLHLRIEARG